MPVSDFVIPGRDKFAPENDQRGLAFPCSACKYRHGSDQDEPCISCDHNLNAKPAEPREDA